MVKRRGPPSQGWRTFLYNHAPDIAAMDLFVVPTHRLRPAVRLHHRAARSQSPCLDQRHDKPHRRMDRALAHRGISLGNALHYLIRDRDQTYGAVVTRRLRAMGIQDRPTAPASPWQTGFAERLIGSIRRESIDHFIVLGEVHLRHILRSHARYYNDIRTRRSLDKDAPVSRPVQRTGAITSNPMLGGLHHHYVRVWVFRYTQGAGQHLASVPSRM